MVVDVKPHEKFSKIYWATVEDGTQRLATKNLIPGKKVYGERLVFFKGVEYRLWDPFRSKLAAAILKGLTTVPIQPNHKILYLGAASGTTAGHVSDIVGEKGHVYCVEFAPRAMRELVNNLCTFRSNMTPIFEDARRPEKYMVFVEEVDNIYCDIAQPEQAKIMADNAELFLKEGSWALLAVKAQSIDVTKEPTAVYRQEADVLKSRGFVVKEVVQLEPYEGAHAMIVSKI